MKKIETLTGLRGIAALIVFISHAANESLVSSAFGLAFGHVGVMIFFVLSGFLMTHLYIETDFNYANVERYALARVGRVFPLYWAVLTLSVLLSNFLFPGFYYSFTDPTVTTLAYGFVSAPYVFWTIPVEVQFYAVFILLWYLYQRQVNRAALAATAALITVPSLLTAWYVEVLPNNVSTYAFVFYLGVGTGLYYDKICRAPKVRQIAAAAGLPILVLIFVNLPQLRYDLGLAYSDHYFLRIWTDPVTLLLVYGLFLCAMLDSRSLAFLCWRPFVFLGEVSYGIYLIHYPILIHLGALKLPPAVTLAVALAITCLLAHLSFKFFETRAAKRIRRLSGAGTARQTKTADASLTAQDR